MNELTLPPSPNWYLSTALACARDGTIAWGTKASLIVAKHISKDNKALTYATIPNIHTEKINSVVFSPDYGRPGRNLIATGGNDLSVKVWDLKQMKLTSTKSFIESEHKVISVDWSRSDPNLICAISSQGSLLTWQYTFNTSQIFHLGKFTASCLSCSPHNPNLIGIGTKSGLIYIVNSYGKIIHKLRGHDYEIVSLSWCPTPLNIFKEDCPKDYLLASGAKDRFIYIWRPATDGRYEVKVPIPNSPQDNTTHRTKLSSNLFTVVLWVEPGILVANSAFGELLALKLNSVKGNSKPDWRVLHGHHSRAIFSISSYVKPQTGEEIKPSDDDNWRTEKEEMVSKNREIWTTGQERQVICTVLGDEDDTWRTHYSIHTLSGYVYCIAPCPLDTSRIAIGVGDGMLRIWNLSEPHETTCDIITAWQDIKDRVTAIAWHPDKENLLAYGTSEGRVGVYDIFNVSKRPVVFKMHHRKTIYRLEWGPSPSTSHSSNDKNPSTYLLFCCGDGELTCFNYDKPQQEPKVIIKKSCTDIAWKPNYSCLAVGHDDGSISFLNDQLETFGKTIFLLKKPVECLTWHPDSTATDLNLSHFRNYLAASTTSPIITVFDMSAMIEMLNKREQSKDTSQNFYKVLANLSGHSDRIYSLAWSPHISGYLVSGSADNTVQVWNIERQEILGTYTDHWGAVQSVMWSPLDHNFIFSGSSDCSLRVWRFPDQKVVLPTAELIGATNKSKKFAKKSTSTYQTNEKSNGEAIKSMVMSAEALSAEESSDKSLERILNVKEKDKKRGKKVIAYFPNYRKQINDKETVLKSCLELARQVKGFESSQTIFGSKDTLSKILDVERETHWEEGHLMMTVEMSLWDNKLKETITRAMETQSLSDFMVSLAPNLSMKFWREVSEAYANQLIQEGNPMKAASYLLSLHKIHAAIDVLLQGKLYKEAYVIAKCKLDPHDEIFKEINREWLGAVIKSGSFEEAALCLVANGDFSEAARMLTRRKDTSILVTSAKLASMGNNQELSDSIIEEALNLELSKFNYDRCKKLLEEFRNSQYRLIQVEAHEELKKTIDENFETNFVENWLTGKSCYGLIETLKNKFDLMKINTENFSSFYNKLKEVAYPPTDGINRTESMLWLSISKTIALAAAAPDEHRRIQHLVETLGAISHYELMHSGKSAGVQKGLFIRVLSILEKTRPAEENSMFYFEGKDKTRVEGVQKSLRVYLCLGLINWLLETISIIQEDNNETLVNSVVELIGKSLEFAMDQESVKYWIRMTKITKLQNALISSENNEKEIQKSDEQEITMDQNELLKRLEEARQAQKNFIEERVCAPSPILIHSKAVELGTLIQNEEVKSCFEKMVTEAWKSAVIFISEK
ncbi:gem-associated protein 5 [Diachasmimorpha longicaudata]|uniref:gem-associated protein 5 n=1 Tax=Diachasmimorpha longicaudata TaxID=58733 RepID=UPI0030B909CA